MDASSATPKPPAAKFSPTCSELFTALDGIEQRYVKRALEVEPALQLIVDIMSCVERVSGACIVVADECRFTVVTSSGTAPAVGARFGDEGLFGACALGRRALRCTDAGADPRAQADGNTHIFASALLLPMNRRDACVGALAIYSQMANGLPSDLVAAGGVAAGLATILVGNLDVNCHLQPLQQGSELDLSGAPSDMTSPAPVSNSRVDAEGELLSVLRAELPSRAKSGLDPIAAVNLAMLEVPGPGKRPWGRSLLAVGIVIIGGLLFAASRYERSRPVEPAPRAGVIPSPRSPVVSGTVRSFSAADSQHGPLEHGSLRSQPRFEYPAEALKQAVQGDVSAELALDEHGVVEAVKSVTGNRMLTDAAASSLTHWRFSPSYQDGRPTRVNVLVVVSYRLKNNPPPTSQPYND